MNTKLIAGALIVATLGACAPRQTPAEVAVVQCDELGMVAGHPDRSACLMLMAGLEQHGRQQARAAAGAALISRGSTCTAYGNSVSCY